MRDTHDGILEGLERKVVFSHLRAAVGLRWELPRLLGQAEIPAGSLCLEVGAGLGWGTLGLVRLIKLGKVVATDYDGTILPMARGYLIQHRAASQVAFCQANAKSLPFPDRTFDVVIALYVLHHAFGYGEALKEIGRVTKPGGQFLFIDFARLPLIPSLRRWFPPEGLPSRSEFTRLLGEAGLRVERWRGLRFWVLASTRKAVADVPSGVDLGPVRWASRRNYDDVGA